MAEQSSGTEAEVQSNSSGRAAVAGRSGRAAVAVAWQGQQWQGSRTEGSGASGGQRAGCAGRPEVLLFATWEGAHHLSSFGKGLIPGSLGLIPGFTQFDSGACPVLHQDCGSSTRFLG